ncbi:SHOCT domain-containing protein [Rhabdothermincola salaria]|uniref:SHOCT domain-containing protein n=1 Tax=Rhabdothermincola salaria TaxID=2903142 RepID=UPI001E63CF57|nr:SHOCT domain-containing protein [Rhabdothermincola salaria]MCD9625217.1 SHOCT domain-containing protein [Rhabdothermincola salaria]
MTTADQPDPPTEAGTTETDGAPVQGRHPRRGWVVALVAVATVLAVLASLTAWVQRQVLNTDNWVAASDELLEDPDVQAALSEYIVSELYAQVDVQAQLADALPEDLEGLAGPAAAALRQPATQAVGYLLDTNQVQNLWSRVNRRAHETLVAVLEDDLNVVSTADGVVTLELGDLVRQLGEQLGLSSDLLDQIPPDVGNIVIAESDELAAAQRAVQITQTLSVWLFVVVIALYALAVFLSVDRRRTIRLVGWSLLGASIVLLVVRRLSLDYVVSMVENPANEAPARSVFMIASALLAQLAWAGVAYGVVLVAGAVYAGPSRAAVAVRREAAPLLSTEPWAVWSTAAVVFGLLVLWSPLPAFDVWWSTLILLAVYGFAVEALRRQSRREFPDAEWGQLREVVTGTARSGWSSVSDWWARRGTNAAAAGTGTASVDSLERLAELHGRGALSDDEYTAAKADVLGLPARPS